MLTTLRYSSTNTLCFLNHCVQHCIQGHKIQTSVSVHCTHPIQSYTNTRITHLIHPRFPCFTICSVQPEVSRKGFRSNVNFTFHSATWWRGIHSTKMPGCFVFSVKWQIICAATFYFTDFQRPKMRPHFTHSKNNIRPNWILSSPVCGFYKGLLVRE